MTGMRFLKGVVVFGGVLILLGSLLLVMRVATRVDPSRDTVVREGSPPTTVITLDADNPVHQVVATEHGFAVWAGGRDGNAEILVFGNAGNLQKHLLVKRPASLDLKSPDSGRTPEN
ncbi:MAG: hypothetical protein HQL77_16220 [Magnetococcales bacterium]|nr:hypothetical protein [Magnetococcales bacterium]